MSDLSVKGRPHSTASEVTIKVIDDHALGIRVEAHVTRIMHLNRPLGDEVKAMKKCSSWWNIGAQETRAEGVNAIEKHLGRLLSLDEWRSMQTEQHNFADGITSVVVIWHF